MGGSSLEEIESLEARFCFFFFFSGFSSSSRFSKNDRRTLIVLVLDRALALSEEEEEEDEEAALDLRLDFFLEDFFLLNFLLERSDLTDLWLFSLSHSLSRSSLLAEVCLVAVRLLLTD